VTSTRKFTGRRLLAVRLSFVGVFGAVTLAMVSVLVSHPSWQGAVAVVCFGACAVLTWVMLGRWVEPFTPGVRPSEYLLATGINLLIVALFALGAWTFSLTPSPG
jgi:hypothetical protein